ncbi:endolytic transglycosylase MltG [Phycicoccus flavus]|uniref:endolytic transglycosylase MltG n=1 Tax=Phycicoccus flavus TaxID=2502783 RepID=UPI000FEC17EB|nr:endolytic transglycosylase MltG [Phycicoccus flavus]NHA69200.1 endolytic transglycosylase MltG [Phycicoccus flavus]
MSQDFTDTIFGDDTKRRPAARSRREIHGRRRPRKRKTGRRLLVLLVAVVLVGGAGYGAYSVLGPIVGGLVGGSDSGDVDYAGPGTGEVRITVDPGQTGEDIATTLRDAGVTKTRTAYIEAARADPQAAAAVQPGTYALRKEMTGAGAFAILTDPANRRTDRVTVREGLWTSETFQALSDGTGVSVKQYEKAAEDAEAIGLPRAADGDVTGWLFPASYEFDKDTSAKDQLAQMVSQTKKTLRDADVPEKDWQRTLTIASIVEGEARGDADRGKVARVVENRLDDPNGPTAGYLQMDSTVNFALQKRGNLTKTEYDSAKTDPYDTYGSPGLPPGPIGNPGQAAIDAAADPTPGGWFFFVTVNLDTGETLFADTYEEQQRNQAKLNQWCDDNPGKCTG